VKFVVASDLHFEFHRDGGRSLVESLAPDVDGAIVAGDLCDASGLSDALDLLCGRFPHVVYLHGNHEFYGSNRDEVLRITDACARRHRGLHVLDKNVIELGGRRFVGAPLWFRRNDTAPKQALNDFRAIKDLESWVYDENAAAVAFFERELREGDVVVSHHLPTQRSVAPQWIGHPLNAFFVCELDALIEARRPALWIHGHTHDSVDVQLGSTRVLCNPFGYVRREENAGFRTDCIVVC